MPPARARWAIARTRHAPVHLAEQHEVGTQRFEQLGARLQPLAALEVPGDHAEAALQRGSEPRRREDIERRIEIELAEQAPMRRAVARALAHLL